MSHGTRTFFTYQKQNTGFVMFSEYRTSTFFDKTILAKLLPPEKYARDCFKRGNIVSLECMSILLAEESIFGDFKTQHKLRTR